MIVKGMIFTFDDKKGVECSRCMLSGTKGLDLNGETVIACFGLGIRPKCPEEGCRKDCPLISVERETICKITSKECSECTYSCDSKEEQNDTRRV